MEVRNEFEKVDAGDLFMAEMVKNCYGAIDTTEKLLAEVKSMVKDGRYNEFEPKLISIVGAVFAISGTGYMLRLISDMQKSTFRTESAERIKVAAARSVDK